ncbi:MAG: hypothetical protein JSW60_08065, partial [Thermoplasmatales archaeon]
MKKETGHLNKIFGGLFLILFSFILLLFTKTQILLIASIPILVSGLDISLQGIHLKRKELHLLSVASFAYALFFMLLYNLSPLWYTIQRISITWSSAIGSLTHKPLSLGPSASGLWIILCFLILLIVSLLLSPSKKQTIRFAFTIVALL